MQSVLVPGDTTAQPPNPRPKPAESPFNRPDADIIIRSKDNVNFAVHKAVLFLSSPVFEDMFGFDNPTSGPSCNDKKETVPVSEDSRTLDLLLRIIYPITNPTRSHYTVAIAVSVYEAGDKYQMPLVLEVMGVELARLSASHPFDMYAAACQKGMEKEAKIAAENSLKQIQVGIPYIRTVHGFTAGACFRLFYYRRKQSVPNGFRFVNPADGPTRSASLRRKPVNSLDSSLFQQQPADVQICCSDGAQLFAHQTNLVVASPTLAKELNTAETQAIDPLTLYIHESGAVVSYLLRLCYPLQQTPVEDIDLLCSVTNLASHYGMEHVTRLIREQARRLMRYHPLRVYCIASQFGWDDEALQAAEYLALNVKKLEELYVPEMEVCSAKGYQDLLVFYRECEIATKRVKEQYNLDLKTGYGAARGNTADDVLRESRRLKSACQAEVQKVCVLSCEKQSY